MRRGSDEHQATAALAARLRERREEIEAAVLNRVLAVSELPAAGGPEYAEGLRVAVAAGIAHGFVGIERSEQGAAPVPDALLAQARLAARSGVSLDTVLRRYLAGHVLLGDFLIEEAERAEELGPAELKRLLRRLAATVDGLLTAVSAVYAEEDARCRRGAERRRAELVERLLGGEPLDTGELDYDFRGWHVGLLASGPGAKEEPAALAKPLDCRLLSVEREEGTVWAWLAFRRRPSPEEVEALASCELPPGSALAIGEPGEGIAGWRLTHRQARAALPIALRSPESLVRYADVALLAAILQDDLLAASLRKLYLEPLEAERDGGETLRETLRAYFAADRNVSSAAVALGVTRKTVVNRLRVTEALLARPIDRCAAELEVALRVEQARPMPDDADWVAPAGRTPHID